MLAGSVPARTALSGHAGGGPRPRVILLVAVPRPRVIRPVAVPRPRVIRPVAPGAAERGKRLSLGLIGPVRPAVRLRPGRLGDLMMAQHRRHAAPLCQRLNLGRCHRVDLLTAPVQEVPVKRHPHGAGHAHHRSADDGSRNTEERGCERACHGGHHAGRDLDRTDVYPPLAAHHPSPHNMHLRWRTPPGNQQGQFRGYAGRPFGSPVFGYPGTVPDPERAGQRPRSSAGVAGVIGPPGEPGRRRASGPRSRPCPAAAHGITRRNAPPCGRPEQPHRTARTARAVSHRSRPGHPADPAIE
jgi:hypothetical protein